MKTKVKTQKITGSSISYDSKMIDYGNDPFVVKKTNASKKFLDKHGFPKELLLKK